MRSALHVLLLLLGCGPLGAVAAAYQARFTENRGQWPAEVLYRARVPGGVMFIERTGFTFLLATGGPFGHHHHGAGEEHPAEPLQMHAYRMQFAGGRAQQAEPSADQGYYENFFQGNDPARWGTRCAVVGEVLLREVWPGIDIRIDGRTGIKYDVVVHPGGDAGHVAFQYTGMEALQVQHGDLVVALSNGSVRESIPASFMVSDDGRRTEVAAAFTVQGDRVSFALPAVPTQARLVIDPTIAFSSYSGSTGDNFGYTATYDNEGHLYGGGTVFDPGYPVTLGVLQSDFLDGGVDIGLSKWSPNGAALLWSTYIGGTRAETPHSLVCNDANEVFLLGATGSNDYPTTSGAFDASFNGGTTINNLTGGWANVGGGYGFSHMFGTDIMVTHFSADATALIGSSYVGGSGNDGLNNTQVLAHTYGDHFRGEIVLNATGEPVVATSTASVDMPVTGNAPQPVFGGIQDAFFFRMDPGLTTLQWATYHGGSGRDNGLGVQLDDAGRMYFTGGTMSDDMPTAGTPHKPLLGGLADGYVARYTAAGNTLQACSFLGSDGFDQSYLIQLDADNDVFILGQTDGAVPISPGRYGIPGSTLFLQKLTNDLSTLLWSTRLGNGLDVKISPTALLVSDCDQIFLSCWAGLAAQDLLNMPLTADAFQSTTDGSDFYLMVLEPDATELRYGTYFGGSQSNEHVDGGTSRFDKNGTVYQAVCAGCGSNDDFPTTPGAWSNTNGSQNCNLGVFKFNLGQPIAAVSIDGPATICPGGQAQFINQSIGGSVFAWDFGDGSALSNETEPVHVFAEPGTYTISLIVSDPSEPCFENDTATIVILVLPPVTADIEPPDLVCPGGQQQLVASGGTDYDWITPEGLSATNIPDPFVTVAEEGTWTVVVSDICSSDTADVFIAFHSIDVTTAGDTSVCSGGSVMLQASGAVSYEWSPPDGLDATDIATPIASPTASTTYTVGMVTAEGCNAELQVAVTVLEAIPEAILQDTIICKGDTVIRSTGLASTYLWDQAPGISAFDVQAPLFFPLTTTRYFVSMVTPCAFVRDSVLIAVQEVIAQAWGDTLVCPGEPVPLRATGGGSYQWTPASGLNDATSEAPTARPAVSTAYTVQVTDDIGCNDSDTVLVELRPWPFVQAGPGGTIDYGDDFVLTAQGNGILSWDDIGEAELQDPAAQTVKPDETTTYIVTVIDSAGCKNTSPLTVIVNGDLYVPNSFTPNGDGYNDGFGASGKDIATLTLEVFDRWGLMVWSTTALEGRWDGTYKGREAPVDTYVWKLSATELSGRQREAIGHVTLVR